MNILITGATGFAGSHLLELLLKQENIHLFGTYRFRTDFTNVNHIKDKVNWKECDITDAHNVEEIIKDISPNIIFHLAANSFVPSSWIHPNRTYEVNLLGSINIFEAVRKFVPECVVQVASSSEVYGPQELMPITEKHIPNPCSPYAVSKIAMDYAAQQYHKSYGLKTVITRAFNHTGPRRGSAFVCSSFAKQVAEIEAGKLEPVIKVGNLLASRDFTDVRDTVRAYLYAVKKCDYGTPYNIASGETVQIQDVLVMLMNYSEKEINIEVDKTRCRPSDLPVLQGDATKFTEKTGWKRKYILDRTLLDLLNYWRERMKEDKYV